MSAYQPKTGERCHCKPGVHRDNCPDCEGTGWRIDFAKIRARVPTAGRHCRCWTVTPTRNAYPLARAMENGAFAIVGEVTGRGGMEAEDRALADAIAQAYNKPGGTSQSADPAGSRGLGSATSADRRKP